MKLVFSRWLSFSVCVSLVAPLAAADHDYLHKFFPRETLAVFTPLLEPLKLLHSTTSESQSLRGRQQESLNAGPVALAVPLQPLEFQQEVSQPQQVSLAQLSQAPRPQEPSLQRLDEIGRDFDQAPLMHKQVGRMLLETGNSRAFGANADTMNILGEGGVSTLREGSINTARKKEQALVRRLKASETEVGHLQQQLQTLVDELNVRSAKEKATMQMMSRQREQDKSYLHRMAQNLNASEWQRSFLEQRVAALRQQWHEDEEQLHENAIALQATQKGLKRSRALNLLLKQKFDLRQREADTHLKATEAHLRNTEQELRRSKEIAELLEEQLYNYSHKLEVAASQENLLMLKLQQMAKLTAAGRESEARNAILEERRISDAQQLQAYEKALNASRLMFLQEQSVLNSTVQRLQASEAKAQQLAWQLTQQQTQEKQNLAFLQQEATQRLEQDQTFMVNTQAQIREAVSRLQESEAQRSELELLVKKETEAAAVATARAEQALNISHVRAGREAYLQRLLLDAQLRLNRTQDHSKHVTVMPWAELLQRCQEDACFTVAHTNVCCGGSATAAAWPQNCAVALQMKSRGAPIPQECNLQMQSGRTARTPTAPIMPVGNTATAENSIRSVKLSALAPGPYFGRGLEDHPSTVDDYLAFRRRSSLTT